MPAPDVGRSRHPARFRPGIRLPGRGLPEPHHSKDRVMLTPPFPRRSASSEADLSVILPSRV